MLKAHGHTQSQAQTQTQILAHREVTVRDIWLHNQCAGNSTETDEHPKIDLKVRVRRDEIDGARKEELLGEPE